MEGLVLARKEDEVVVIDLREWGLGIVAIGVVEIADKVRLIFSGDRRIPIHRKEVYDAIEREKVA